MSPSRAIGVKGQAAERVAARGVSGAPTETELMRRLYGASAESDDPPSPELEAALERERLRVPISVPPPPTPVVFPQHMPTVVTSVRLTWGDVWDVAFKFSVVFFLINAIGGLVLYLLIVAAT